MSTETKTETKLQIECRYEPCTDPDTVITAGIGLEVTTNPPNGYIPVEKWMCFVGERLGYTKRIFPHYHFRRRIETPAPEAESAQHDKIMLTEDDLRDGMGDGPYIPKADIVRHEVAELRKANAELRKDRDAWKRRAESMEATIKERVTERDQLKTELASEQSAKVLLAEAEKRITELQVQLAKAERDKEQRIRAHNSACEIIDELRGQLAAARQTLENGKKNREWVIEQVAKLKEDLVQRGDFAGAAVVRSVVQDIIKKVPIDKTQQPPAAPVEEWRELTRDEQYSGPGQVRDVRSDDWCDARIIFVDNDDNLFPFVAKIDGNGNHFGSWKFARVRTTPFRHDYDGTGVGGGINHP